MGKKENPSLRVTTSYQYNNGIYHIYVWWSRAFPHSPQYIISISSTLHDMSLSYQTVSNAAFEPPLCERLKLPHPQLGPTRVF